MTFDYIATPLVAALGAEMTLKDRSANQGAAPVAPPSSPAWQALVPGDTVALIAPSYATQKDYYADVADAMRAWGLNVIQPEDMVLPGGYYTWPNTPERRADHIIDALRNPQVKAIFALEGGEGASEVVEMLKRRQGELDALPKRAIPLIGYSDITHLHHFLGQKGLVSAVQGPSTEFLAERPGMDDTEKAGIARNQEALKAFLMGGQQQQPDIALIPLNQAAKDTPHIKGTLIGGGDVPIVLADEASHRLATDAYSGQILFLEGRNSKALKMTLAKLQQRHQLGGVDAIVLGRYYDNQQYTGDLSQAYTAEIKQVFEEMGITKPVYFGVPAGHPNHALHSAPVIPVPMRVRAEINATPEAATLSLGRFRDMAECEYARSIAPAETAPAVRAPAPGKGSIELVNIPMNELKMPDVSEAMDKDFTGRKAVLNFGDHATIPLMHMAMMELHGAGKLNGAESILIASSRDMPQEVKSWLGEFQQRHLPEVPLLVATLENTAMLSVLAGKPHASVMLGLPD